MSVNVKLRVDDTDWDSTASGHSWLVRLNCSERSFCATCNSQRREFAVGNGIEVSGGALRQGLIRRMQRSIQQCKDKNVDSSRERKMSR